MKFGWCIALTLLFVFTMCAQNTLDLNSTYMDNKISKNLDRDGYSLIKLELINDSIQVYFKDDEESIILFEPQNKGSSSFDNYLEFTKVIINKYVKNDSYLESYTDIVPFNPLYLRYNFVFNKDKVLNLKKTKHQFLEKLNSLVGFKTSNVSEGFIEQLNRKLNHYTYSKEAHLHQMELPLLVFICQYVMDKYNGELVIRRAENDLMDSFFVPDVKVNNVELNLNKRLFRYLYHPEMDKNTKPIDIEAFLYLIDFLIKGNISVKRESNE
nr:hypothetical protein [uncultured Allomuricauda sp.]